MSDIALKLAMTRTYYIRSTLIKPDLWPSNSPDLHPVDYAVWGAFQKMTYQPFTSNNLLKQAIVTEWNSRSIWF